jgi:hypothetical protein
MIEHDLRGGFASPGVAIIDDAAPRNKSPASGSFKIVRPGGAL